MHGHCGGGRGHRPPPYLQPATPGGPAAPGPGRGGTGRAPFASREWVRWEPPAPAVPPRKGVLGGVPEPPSNWHWGAHAGGAVSVPCPQITPTFEGPPIPCTPNFHRVPSLPLTHPSATPRVPAAPTSPPECPGMAGGSEGSGAGGTALLHLGRACVRVSVLLPPRDPPQSATIPGSNLGRGRDGQTPPRTRGKAARAQGTAPRQPGTPQTPMGAPGGLSPPSPHAASHPVPAAPAQPPHPVPRGPHWCPGRGHTRGVPIFPRESAPRRSAGGGAGPSAPGGGRCWLPGVPCRAARNRPPAPRRC